MGCFGFWWMNCPGRLMTMTIIHDSRECWERFRRHWPEVVVLVVARAVNVLG